MPTQDDLKTVGKWVKALWRADDALYRKSGNAKLFKSFGLARPLNPAKSYGISDLLSAFDRPDFGEVMELGRGDVTKQYRRGVVLIAFDLRWNLQQQLRDAKQLLSDEGRNLQLGAAVERVHPPRWTLYLRVLDSQNAGATLTQVARVLLNGGSGSVRDLLPKAHEMLAAAKALQTKLTS